MPEVILGIDPDSKAHGVAVYEDGKLVDLDTMTLIELYKMIARDCREYEVHIEHVCGNNASFHGGRQPVSVQKDIGRRIGMVQQAQIEVERMVESIGFKVVRHKISKTWKKDKAQFERVTGWTKRSNEDTRSAAYFGFLGCK